MAGIDPRAQAKLSKLADLTRSAQTIYGLTERFAAARSNADQFAHTLKRRYAAFKRNCMLAGFDKMAQMASSMEIAAGRGGSQRVKARALREGIGSIRFQLDAAERILRAEKPSKGKEDDAAGKEKSGGKAE